MSKERSHAGEAYDIAAATSDRRGEPAHAGPTIDWGIPLPPSKAAPDSLLAGLKSGAWLDAQTFPELRYTVPLIIPEGTTVLAGAPKVGKSWMVFHIGLSVAAGHHVLGCLPTGRPRPVLYLALEDGWRRLQSRARSLLGMGKQIPAALDVLIEVQHGLVAATILEWLEVHGDEAPLVIVDTLGRVMPRSNAGESAYERDYRAVTTYKQVTDRYPGSSMVLVHHTRKLGSEDFVDGVSGTLGITGAADTTVVLSRSRSDDGGLLKVTGRDITEAEYAVEKADNGFWKLTGGSIEEARKAASTERVTAGVSDRSADIIRLVAESDGIGPTEIGQKLGIETKAAGTYLSRLETAGRIKKVKRGVYRSVEAQIHTLHTLHTPTWTDDEDGSDDPC
ncbi:MAG: AAA family ATPase [Pseudonocardia sp.]|uniref:AAA family ATPase n=1 Tax=Pseudonocardia sp. TaxID=60912 RepID=UPI001AC62FCD|nr:AAA family ATPase [Pseudonocardia sp.]MBN9103274.1 AAA family ATPase [Pseudonocardia sp.]